MQLYHDVSEREPVKDGDGDNSRPESNQLAGLSQSRFLVNCREALGLTYEQTLDSSIALIESMLQEYIYIQREKNKALHKNDNVDENGRKFEWVELPSFDNPREMIRYKKYDDIGDAYKEVK